MENETILRDQLKRGRVYWLLEDDSYGIPLVLSDIVKGNNETGFIFVQRAQNVSGMITEFYMTERDFIIDKNTISPINPVKASFYRWDDKEKLSKILYKHYSALLYSVGF